MSRSLPIRSAPETNLTHLLGHSAISKGGYLYVAHLQKRPDTVVIYNVATNGTNWVRIPAAGTNLSGVLAWKLGTKGGSAFEYAFSATPSTQMSAYGSIQRDTDLETYTAIWARLKSGEPADTYELEIWS